MTNCAITKLQLKTKVCNNTKVKMQWLTMNIRESWQPLLMQWLPQVETFLGRCFSDTSGTTCILNARVVSYAQ